MSDARIAELVRELLATSDTRLAAIERFLEELERRTVTDYQELVRLAGEVSAASNRLVIRAEERAAEEGPRCAYCGHPAHDSRCREQGPAGRCGCTVAT